jgi:hypothetical protein
MFKSRAMVEQTLLSPVTSMESHFFEMYIQNAGWREQWNEILSIKLFSFAKGKSKSFTRVHDSILG